MVLLLLFVQVRLCGHNGQVLTIDDLETNYFVLVHGAWCWYKTIAPLEHAGFKDLTGSGVHSFDTNSITSLSQYAKPLIAFLENLAHGHKFYQFLHLLNKLYGSSPPLFSLLMEYPSLFYKGDFGDACKSFELYPSKVSKAIFVAATMLTSGQRALDVFSEKHQRLASEDIDASIHT
ncbi:hypothetical protein MTR67_012449 [Solanum verrucosum]|uniref:Uncharacterized protein n=1 Tax=Solanum verrucosum TaxID=315347 RepID=A0AAF0Q8K7_SOLVR|nr:hypothetical protein MTR67_012449 [Solanum verrucosum]